MRAAPRAVERSSAAGEPLHPSERALIEQLLAFPGSWRRPSSGARRTAIAAYALELAQGFTAFYRDCRVVGAEPEAVESLRIALCVAARARSRAAWTCSG